MPLTREDSERIMAEVRANMARLAACSHPHAFRVIDATDARLWHRYRCAKCGGEADGVAVRWYENGLHHGQRGAK